MVGMVPQDWSWVCTILFFIYLFYYFCAIKGLRFSISHSWALFDKKWNLWVNFCPIFVKRAKYLPLAFFLQPPTHLSRWRDSSPWEKKREAGIFSGQHTPPHCSGSRTLDCLNSVAFGMRDINSVPFLVRQMPEIVCPCRHIITEAVAHHSNI